MLTRFEGRRKIHWSRIRGPRNIIAFLVATALGTGLTPIAPGTAGTLLAVPLAYASADWDIACRVALWAVILFIGVWGAQAFDSLMETGDNQNIVIDEVLGLGITAWTAGPNVFNLLVAFFIFRIFDIVKLPPIHIVDRWSKTNPSAWARGVGIMTDDVLAGFQGLLVIMLLQHWGILVK